MPPSNPPAVGSLAAVVLADGLHLLSWWLRGAGDGSADGAAAAALAVAALDTVSLVAASALPLDRAASLRSGLAGACGCSAGRGGEEEGGERWRALSAPGTVGAGRSGAAIYQVSGSP